MRAPSTSPLQRSTFERIKQEVLGCGCQEFLICSRTRNVAEARQDWFHPGRCAEMSHGRRSRRGHAQGGLVMPHCEGCVVSGVATRVSSAYLLLANLKRLTTLVRCQHLCWTDKAHLFALDS